jgi:tetratricopeptide (TPR) repeat protein
MKNVFFCLLLFLVVGVAGPSFGQTPANDPIKTEYARSGSLGAIRKYDSLRKHEPAKNEFWQYHARDFALEIYRKGQIEDARKLFAMNVKNSPTSSESAYFLGMAEFKLGKKANALKTLQKAYELDPKNIYARDLMQAINNPKEYATYMYACPPCYCSQHEFKFKEPGHCIECMMEFEKIKKK